MLVVARGDVGLAGGIALGEHIIDGAHLPGTDKARLEFDFAGFGQLDRREGAEDLIFEDGVYRSHF